MHQYGNNFFLPTPPASPSHDNSKCQPRQQPFLNAPRHSPVTPEERLGLLLDGVLYLDGILGTGAYGVVYSGRDINTGIRYAVKCLSKFNADGTPLERRQVAYQQREIRLHHQASEHPNVVSILKIIDTADCIYVVLEFCPEGDLFASITERGHYVGKDELSRKIFLQILDAVEHCHKLGIYHRDLKPENILVTDKGYTVKLADFGLATSDSRSEDYGCGSTFYMSPECLDASARKPYYMCAPNDVWSLGVILVNLTCGRNPWKQASFQDSTYRAYARSADFLKTILPVTDELNDILGRIFNPNPEHRITLAELRERIVACPNLTVPPMSATLPPTPPVATENFTQYVIAPEEAIMDDDSSDDEAPQSPLSTYSDGSLTSSVSTIDDLDDDDFIQEDHRQQQQQDFAMCPPIYEPEMAADQAFFRAQEFVPQQYTGPLPPSPVGMPQHQPPQPPMAMHCAQQPMPVQPPASVQSPCAAPKSYFFPWDLVNKYVQQVPMMQHPVSFHQRVPVLPSFQGF